MVAQQGSSSILYAGFGFGEFSASTELAIAAFKPSFNAAASMAKHGTGSVPLFLKKNIFIDPLLKRNNALYLGNIKSSTAIAGSKTLNVIAPVLTLAAVGTTLYDIQADGKLTAGDLFQGINTGLMVAFPIYGVAYGVVDLGFCVFTDQSLTDRIKNGIDSKVTGSLNVPWK